MKKYLIAAAIMASIANPAHAWFFFFLPGSAIDRIGDTVTGEKGNKCITATAKIGDEVRFHDGTTGIVAAIDGPSVRCPLEHIPIRATVVFGRPDAAVSASQQIPAPK